LKWERKRRKKRDGNTPTGSGQAAVHRGRDTEGTEKNKEKEGFLAPQTPFGMTIFLHLAEMGSSGARPYKNKIRGRKQIPRSARMTMKSGFGRAKNHRLGWRVAAGRGRVG